MSQILKKFIGANQVDQTKVRLDNNTSLRARNAANSADVNIVKVNASDRIEFLSVPQSTADAVAANDIVRYSQLAALSDGLKPKAAVRVASTANGTLATAFANGQVVDGVTLVTGDRILLWQQTAPAENGIYTVNASGAPTRATDFDAPSEIPGAYTVAQFGTLYQGTLFVSLSSPGTIGVDPINFAMRSITTGANTSLSNLSSTAVNVDLLPAGDEGINLGAPANRWANGYIGALVDSTSNIQIELDLRQLLDSSSTIALDWNARELRASDGVTTMIQWADEAVGVLIGRDLLPVNDNTNNIGGASNRWVNMTMTGAISDGTFNSIDIGLRQLYDTAGNLVADYSTTTGGSEGQGVFALKKEVEFQTGGANAYIRTKDGIGPEGLIIESGSVTGSSSGDMYLRSGTADTSTTGSLYLISGDGGAADVASGNANLMTGAVTGTAASGVVQLYTGTSVDGNTGDINIINGIPSGIGLRGKTLINTRQLWFHGDAADQGLEQIILGVDGGQPTETGVGIITHDATAGNTSDGMYFASGAASGAGSSSGGISISTAAADQNTGTLNINTGAATVGASGGMVFATGSGGTSNGSGAISFATGGAQGGQVVGAFSITTGAPVDGPGGAISLATSNASGDGNVGQIQLQAGNSGGVGSGGSINLYAGNSGVTGPAGSVNITAGNSVGGTAGLIVLQGGNGTTGVDGGIIQIQPGAGNASDGGDLLLYGGDASGPGETGSVIIKPGQNTGGGATVGFIKLQANSPTVGWVWTATNADGSGEWAATGAGSFANTALSNLDVTTAINSNLLPDGYDNREIGSRDFQWNRVFTRIVQASEDLSLLAGSIDGNPEAIVGHNIQIVADSDNLAADISGGAITIRTADIQVAGTGIAVTGAIAIYSGSQNSGGVGATGNVGFGSGSTDGASVTSGNVSITTGDTPGTSGNILLHTGVDGVRGKIQFTDGSEGTAGYVWTSTDGAGSGTWNRPLIQFKDGFTLISGDITNQYVDLTNPVAQAGSVNFLVKGAGGLLEGVDYSVDPTGGAGGVGRITFINDLATGGPSALIVGDVLEVQYTY